MKRVGAWEGPQIEAVNVNTTDAQSVRRIVTAEVPRYTETKRQEASDTV